VTARVLDLVVAGTIALWTSAVETFEVSAEEFEILRTLNLLLSQCLSAEVEKALVPHD
jgi:hypothetical protein